MSQAQIHDVVPAGSLTVDDERDAHGLKMRQKLYDFTVGKINALPPLSDTLEEFHVEIPVRDGWLSKCRVVRPKSSGRPRPLIVDFYGGGFGAGHCDQLTVPARNFAEEFNAVVVLPSYRLTPEKRFPIPEQDVWDVVSFLSHHAETDDRFHATLDPSVGGGFIIAGVSAGGTHSALAPGIDLMLSNGLDTDAQDLKGLKPLPNKITGTFVCIAMLIFKPIVPEEYKDLFTSRIDNADASDFSAADCEDIVASLRIKDWNSVWLSPFNALKQLRKSGTPVAEQHPKTYLQACQLDPVRDDVIIYEKYLREQLGVKTKINVFMDDQHAAWTTMDFPNRSTNPTIPEATMEGMKWLLNQ